MADIFLSYARTSKEAAARLAGALEADGYDVWWDAELPPHRTYAEVIEEEIGKAKAVVVAWSANAAESQWVRAEADMARQQNKLVQTSTEKGFIPPIPFNQIQVAELAGWDGDPKHPEWSKVRAAVSELVRQGPPGPPPKRPKAPPRLLPFVAVAGLAVLLAGAFAWSRLGNAPPPANAPVTVDAAPSAPPTTSANAWLGLAQAKLAAALILNAGMTPTCNGALLGLRRVVTVAGCDIVSGGAYYQMNDGTIYPLVMTSGGKPRVQGVIAVYEFVAAAPGANPPALAERTPEGPVRAGAFVSDEAFLTSNPCRLSAPDAEGLRTSDCANPGNRQGTPVFGEDGRVVGLLRADGKVVSAERIGADLLAMGVSPN